MSAQILAPKPENNLKIGEQWDNKSPNVLEYIKDNKYKFTYNLLEKTITRQTNSMYGWGSDIKFSIGTIFKAPNKFYPSFDFYKIKEIIPYKNPYNHFNTYQLVLIDIYKRTKNISVEDLLDKAELIYMESDKSSSEYVKLSSL